MIPFAHPPGLVIAAPRSGSGKTTVTLGLLRAFARAGVTVTGTKNGPDYIDPAFHAAASGRPSLNLDAWAMPPALVQRLAQDAGTGCDLVLCEGSMGLFDGVPGTPGRSGSSADIAAALSWPVLLVVDVSGQAQTAAAQARGMADHDKRIKIAGVILNRVASGRHKRMVVEAMQAVGLRVVGCLPKDGGVSLPERHLGLVQAGETTELDAVLDRMATLMAETCDLAVIRALADAGGGAAVSHSAPAIPPPGQRIALAQDAAFSFIYPHLLADWRRAGAEIVPFSPMADAPPPAGCDVCWLPGGYPELHAGHLAAQAGFLDGLRRFAATKPVHGECGGYMVLGQSLTDASGTAHVMAGLLGVQTSFAKRKMNLGYRQARLAADCALGLAGQLLRGHEFHYATTAGGGDDAPFAACTDAYGTAQAETGGRRGTVTGSFFHAIAHA